MHCFNYLGAYIKQIKIDKDKIFFSWLKKLIYSWLLQYKGTSEKQLFPKYCWHDHSTAFRARNFCEFYKLLIDNREAGDEQLLYELLISIYEHMNLLLKKDFFKKYTNHGIDQAISLIWIGETLNNQNTLEIGKKLLIEEFNFAFTQEGIHKENSPFYHNYVLDIFLNAFERFENIIKNDNVFLENLNKALIYLCLITRPDGNLPLLGDTELKNPQFSNEKILSLLPAYDLWKDKNHLTNKEVFGKKTYFFPISGYAIFTSYLKCKDFHLVLKVGSLAHYHYHADESHFVLYAYEEDWLIDSGFLNYFENEPLRKLVRSRYAHNVPIFTDGRYFNIDVKFLKWKINEFSEYEKNSFISMTYLYPDNITMKRRLSILESRIILIDDIIENNTNETEIEILFHTPANKKILINGNLLSIKSKTKTLYLNISSYDYVDSYITSGISNNKYQDSITSKKAYEYESSQCIHCRFIGSKIIKSQISLSFFDSND